MQKWAVYDSKAVHLQHKNAAFRHKNQTFQAILAVLLQTKVNAHTYLTP